MSLFILTILSLIFGRKNWLKSGNFKEVNPIFIPFFGKKNIVDAKKSIIKTKTIKVLIGFISFSFGSIFS